MPKSPSSQAAWLAALWFGAVVVGLLSRPLLPIDETRYLTVAWEMHFSGNWLVPHLNGEAYSHKPPLLFWLINLLWMVTGVSEFAGRAVAPLFGLGALLATGWLARLLWPESPRVAWLAPLIVMGSGFWLLFGTLTYFDIMMAFWSVLGACGLVLARRGRWLIGFALFGISIGLGVLSKGPVILLYLLTPALLAPVWARGADWGAPVLWLRWYAGVVGGVVLGAAIALAWALPAAKAGGEVFGNAILWGQTAGRVTESFAHKRPFWWYLPVLPGILFPWVIWPPFWRGIIALRQGVAPALRLPLVWFAVAVLVFSTVSAKQPHYLLPLYPAFALFLARVLDTQADEIRHSDPWLPSIFMLLLGVLICGAPAILWLEPKWLAALGLPDFSLLTYEAIGATLIAAAIACLAVPLKRRPERLVPLMLLLPFAAFLALHLLGFPMIRPLYELRPTAAALKVAEQTGHEIAFAGDYHGEYHFLGRLEKPLQEIEPGTVVAWAMAHPEGVIVTRHRELPTRAADPVHQQRFRGRITTIWAARDILKDPGAFAVR